MDSGPPFMSGLVTRQVLFKEFEVKITGKKEVIVAASVERPQGEVNNYQYHIPFTMGNCIKWKIQSKTPFLRAKDFSIVHSELL